MSTVSVIVPTYNRATQLQRAISSVLCQTYRQYEIIVVDDGSTDNTKEIVASLGATEQIRYFYQANRGRSAARNTGIRMAQGDFIAFLDSDDLFLPDKLQKQTEWMLRNSQFGFSYSRALWFDEITQILLAEAPVFNSKLEGRIYPALLSLTGTAITTPTVMTHASILREIGGFDENLHICEDLDLWRRIARHYPVGFLPMNLSLISYRPFEGDILKELNQGIDARTAYYAKACKDDPQLVASFYPFLMAEMYSHYGIGASQNKRFKYAFKLILKAWQYSPHTVVTYLFSYYTSRMKARRERLMRAIRRRLGRTELSKKGTPVKLEAFLDSHLNKELLI
jgi:glycosyltransferase involved in cell wall biosynthesis